MADYSLSVNGHYKDNGVTSGLKKVKDSISSVSDSSNGASKSIAGFGELLKANLVSSAVTSGLSAIASGIKKVTGELVNMGKAAYSEGADLEQSIGGVETLFKSASDTVKKYAAQSYETAGISTNSYMEQATSFSAALISSLNGDVDKAAEITNQAIIDMADNSNKMGTGLENIQNAYQGFAKQNYTMLDNLKLGYGGTKTEMQRLLADAQKLSGVEYDIDNLADVYEAIHVIQQELDITGTTAKEAATTMSGSFNQLKASWKNLLGNITLGNDITDQLTAVKDSLSTYVNNLTPAIGNMLDALPAVVDGFINIADEITTKFGTEIETRAPALIASGKKMMSSIVTGLSNLLPNILKIGGNIVTNLVTSLAQNAPRIIHSIVTTSNEVFKNFASAISEMNLPQIGADIMSEISRGLQLNSSSLANEFVNALNGLVSFISNNAKSLGDIAGSIVKGVIGAINTAATAISSTDWNSVFSSVLDSLNTFFSSIFTEDNCIDMASAVGSLAGSIVQMIMAGVKTAITALQNTDWQGIFNTLTESLKSFWSSFLSKSGADGIATDLKDMFGMGEDSNNSKDSRSNDLVAGFVGFLGNMIDDAFGFLVNNEDWINNIATNLLDGAFKIVNSLGDGVAKMMNNIFTGNNLQDFIHNVVVDACNYLTENGGDILNTVLKVAAQVLGALVKLNFQIAGGIVGGIIDVIMNTDWLEVGKSILMGITKGIINVIGYLGEAILDGLMSLMDGITDSIFGVKFSSIIGYQFNGWDTFSHTKDANGKTFNDLTWADVTGSTTPTSTDNSSYVGDVSTNNITNNIYQQPGESTDDFVDRVVAQIRSESN